MKWPFFNRKKKKEGRHLVKTVDEKVGIRESRTAIVTKKLEFSLYFLLATLAVTIGVPLAMLGAGQADRPSTIISLVSGLAAFGLGLFAVKQVRHIFHSEGG